MPSLYSSWGQGNPPTLIISSHPVSPKGKQNKTEKNENQMQLTGIRVSRKQIGNI